MSVARTAFAILALAAIVFLAGCGADPAFTSGKVYLQQENYTNAIEQFKIAIRNDEMAWEPHMWLGRAYADTEELQMAHDEFFLALDLAPDQKASDAIDNTITSYWQKFQQEGNLLNSASKFVDAILEFEKAIVIDPRKPDAYANLGYAFHMNMDYDKAIEAFEAALSLAPGNEDLVTNLVSVYDSKAGNMAVLGDLENALRYYEKIEGIAPDTKDIHYNIAETYYGLKDYREAIVSYERSLVVDGEDEYVLYRVFLCYWGITKKLEDEGMPELAIPELESALNPLERLAELNPEDLSTHRALARVYNKLGRTEEAMLELGIVEELLQQQK
jgi:tetratricopeptide (TPR) repeat protein